MHLRNTHNPSVCFSSPAPCVSTTVKQNKMNTLNSGGKKKKKGNPPQSPCSQADYYLRLVSVSFDSFLCVLTLTDGVHDLRPSLSNSLLVRVVR